MNRRRTTAMGSNGLDVAMDIPALLFTVQTGHPELSWQHVATCCGGVVKWGVLVGKAGL